MSIAEDLDREIIIERAEEVRNWLGSLGLSSRSTGALEKELAGIIENDPGGYINGHRPLAGLTVADVLAELQRPNGGAVGQVRGVGDRVIAELRTALGNNDSVVSEDGEGAPNGTEPIQELQQAAAKPRGRTRRASTEQEAQVATIGVQDGTETATPKPRRHTQKATAPSSNGITEQVATNPQNGAERPQELAEQPARGETPKRRGRPRRTETAVPEPVVADLQVAIAQDTGTPEADTAKPARRGRPRRTETTTETQPVAVQETRAPEADQPKRRGRPRRVETAVPEAAQEAPEAPEVTEGISRVVELSDEAEKAAQTVIEQPGIEAPTVIESKRRGRPRKAATSAPAQAEANGAVVIGAPNGATAAPEQVAEGKTLSALNGSYDPSLERLMQLWPSLHPQGRRAIVLYASTLVFEEIAS